MLRATRDGASVNTMRKGLIALLAFVLGLYVSVGCGVVHAGMAMEAPCCGNNCPTGSAIGESACCHAQDSGAAAQAISRPSLPVGQPLVSLVSMSIMLPARIGFEQAFVLQGSPPGASPLALLCSRQI